MSPLRRLAVVWLAGLALLALATGYWQVVAAPALQANPNNGRASYRLSLIQPGKLLTSDGTVILTAQREAEGWRSEYPEPQVFCHLTGYNQRTGLQAGLREALLGLGRYSRPWQAFLPGGMRGEDVVLTLNAEAQRVATQALRGYRGAVVALDPRDGAVRVLVSAPAYDPQTVTTPEAYELFRSDPHSAELDRALQGLYTPGSALKALTAAIGLQVSAATPTTQFTCAGTETVGGTRVSCPKVHGKLDLTAALAESCNISFAKLGLLIGPERFRDYVRRFHLLDSADLSLPSAAGRMSDLSGPRVKQYLAHTAYGQWQTLVTPLAMARLAATLARGGTVIQPYLVAEVRSPSGEVLQRGQGRELGQAVSPATARQVAGMMQSAVEKGTAGVLRIPGLTVAAKTGTAQKNQAKPDVWIIAFAPVENPTVALAVVIEGGESGGQTAGPIAREVLRALLGG